LLTRLVACSTGGKAWGDLPLDQLQLSQQDRDLVQRCLVFETSPYVRRVVFVATPHHGSFRVKGWIERLATRILKLPTNMLGLGQQLVGLRERDVKLPPELRRGVPTAVTNMQPGSFFDKTLNSLPIAPQIKANSIIAVAGNGPVESGNDTVVEYKSAHIEGMESEFVVRSPHSCQGHPATIEEVRRILLLHVQSPTAKSERP
jgi:hypothetical protein